MSQDAESLLASKFKLIFTFTTQINKIWSLNKFGEIVTNLRNLKGAATLVGLNHPLNRSVKTQSPFFLLDSLIPVDRTLQ